jgi:hypothetical protein
MWRRRGWWAEQGPQVLFAATMGVAILVVLGLTVLRPFLPPLP